MVDPKEPQEILTDAEAAERDREEAAKDEERRDGFSLEVAGENVSEAIDKLRTQVSYWADRGRYNKVRIKRNGKAILPDIPVGALLAFEASTFFWTGLLRGALVNVVGRFFFEVEMINEAEEFYKRGLEHFLAGEMADAEKEFDQALKIDPRYPRAHLQMGVLRKIQGDIEGAKSHFENAVVHDKGGDTGREAEVHLKKLEG